MNNQIMLQIHTGGYKGEAVSYKHVLNKLEAALRLIPASAVLMGWSLDPVTYEKTCRYLNDRGIELYLWLPVYSETGLLEKCAPIIGYTGEQARSYHLSAGESFEFYCPNNPENADNALAVFAKYFDSIGFDGVFLDKIRYPSFANGLEGGLSCFCPRCLESYGRAGFDAEALERKIHDKAGHDAPFGIISYQDGAYTFKDDIWRDFFALKSRFVFDSVSRICAWFRQKDYKIGLDVFAPFMSAFVGQDIPKLSQLCDFIKPMMYRATSAPAGLPFELLALMREADVPAESVKRILGIDPHMLPFDLSFAARELDNLAKTCDCPVYAGLEVNRKPGIAEADPAYIKETLGAFSKTSVSGFVLSWDILDAPIENIMAVCDN